MHSEKTIFFDSNIDLMDICLYFISTNSLVLKREKCDMYRQGQCVYDMWASSSSMRGLII